MHEQNENENKDIKLHFFRQVNTVESTDDKWEREEMWREGKGKGENNQKSVANPPWKIISTPLDSYECLVVGFRISNAAESYVFIIRRLLLRVSLLSTSRITSRYWADAPLTTDEFNLQYYYSNVIVVFSIPTD